MNQILRTGQAIGVVDFNQDDLQKLMGSTGEMLMINQYVIRIGNIPLLDFYKEHKIAVVDYSPVTRGLLLRALIVKQLARKYQVSVNQLCIRNVAQ